MKAAALLLALLCLDAAQALRCHNCTDFGEQWVDCYREVTCRAQDQACMVHFIYITFPSRRISGVFKYCVDSCETQAPLPAPPAARSTVWEHQVMSRCCMSDLCNGAAGRGPGAASGLLLPLLLPGALAALLGASP